MVTEDYSGQANEYQNYLQDSQGNCKEIIGFKDSAHYSVNSTNTKKF